MITDLSSTNIPTILVIAGLLFIALALGVKFNIVGLSADFEKKLK